MQLQIGVKVIIKNSLGKYLLIKRAEQLQNETELFWDIPGGRIDTHEHLHEALVREVYEEVGITLNGTTQLVNAQDIFVESKQLHVVRLTYLLSQDIDDITLSHEHDAHKWCTIDETVSMNIDPYLKETLQLI